MAKAQKDMGGLGPLAILRETFHITWTNSKLFLLIQLILVLPGTLSTVIFYSSYHTLLESNNLSSTQAPLQTATTASEGYSAPNNMTIQFWLLKILFDVGAMVVNRSIQAFWTVGAVHAVGLIYNGKRSISFMDVVHAIPRSQKRLLMVYLWISFFGYFITHSPLIAEMATGIPLDGVNNLAEVKGLVELFTPRYEVPMIVGIAMYMILVRVLVQGAAMAAVLEPVEGETNAYATFKKSSDVSKGKLWVSMGVTFLSCLPMLIPMYLEFVFETKLPELASFESFACGLPLLIWVALVVLASFTVHFQTLAAAALFVSCKAFHCESVTLAEDPSYDPIISDGTDETLEENRRSLTDSEERQAEIV